MWAFRPLARADFPVLARWLAEPHVARWWHHEYTVDALERDFGESIDRTDPGEVFVASLDGRDVGLIQRFLIEWYPDYAAELEAVCELRPGAASIDYFVGERDLVGRGVGTAMIAAFVERLWADYPQATSVLVAVHADNVASWRALEKAGFRRVAAGEMTPDTPFDDRRHVLYERTPGARFILSARW